ncbi:sel1 repeat family protein [Simiduia sp. 21SJ11W-1]|uniref:tetratricopeptide repeat protein n=1 Tax=Simiduia sp. 21SJ11W-1 TaxID=2909669 RepID=UPI00209F9B25|nr:tetratricopeptide repeat protein [Simiduia sp. 21SJ11W-1]UTA47821.1 sel1 repeat family protein [Simiduia sp. 21SJ11W-1]
MPRHAIFTLVLFTGLCAQPASANDFAAAANAFDEQRYQDALPLLEAGDRAGDLRAAYLLCLMYEQGLGVEADLHRSFNLCHKGADHGFPPALNHTAAKYALGLGTDQNLDRAITLYKKSAELGDVTAMLALGEIYGGSIEPDRFNPTTMMHYLRRAAETGQPEGLFMYGVIQLTLADSFPNQHWSDVKDGLKALTRAANMNFADAQFALGNIYFDGKFVQASAADALFWFTLAQRAGHGEAKERRYDLELSANAGIRNAVTRRLRSWAPQPVTPY